MLRGLIRLTKCRKKETVYKKKQKKHIGIKNQKNFLSVFIANKKENFFKKKSRKMIRKWVPIEGFAKIEKQDA